MASPVKKMQMDFDESEDDRDSSEENESAEDTRKEKKKEKIQRPRVTHVGNGEIKLSWEAIEGCHQYRIRCIRRIGSKDKGWDFVTPDAAYTISGVDSGSEYELSIEGNGEVSEAISVVTGPLPPTNIHAEPEPSSPCDSIRVSFNSPDEESTIYHKVILTEEEEGIVHMDTTDRTFFVSRGLKPGQHYIVSVQSFSRNLYSGPAMLESKIAYSPSEIQTCPSKVTIEYARYVGEGLAKIKCSRPFGITEYLVQYKGRNTARSERMKPMSELTIHSLAFGQLYTVVVAASNKGGLGPFSDPVEIRTGPAAPREVRVQRNSACSETSLMVFIDDIDSASKSYEITAEPVEEGETVKIVSCNKSCEINGLAPAKQYIVKVVTIIYDPEGHALRSSPAFASEEVVPYPPINLKVSSFDFPNTSILVSFDDPNHGLQCQYRVIAKNIRTGEKMKVESDLNSISIENLEVGGQYLIAAQCINSGAESKTTVFDQVIRIFGGGPPSIIDSAYQSEFSLLKNLDDEGDKHSILMLGEEAGTKTKSKIEIDTSGLRVSPIQKEVRKVLPNLHKGSMQKLLDTFYEIGIHEVSDLEYLLDEDVAKEAKYALRIVEFKKLLKHARGIKESNSRSEVTEPEEITVLPSDFKSGTVIIDSLVKIDEEAANVSEKVSKLTLLEEIEREFDEKMKQKAEDRNTIGTKGGNISLLGSSLSVPPESLKEEREITISVDNNPKNYPLNLKAVSMILDLKPSIEFEKPVTVTMQTWYSALEGKTIPAVLSIRETEDSPWKKLDDIKLGSGNEVRFTVKHFTGFSIGVNEEHSKEGKYTVFNDIYIQQETAFVHSSSYLDPKSEKDMRSIMRSKSCAAFSTKALRIVGKPEETVSLVLDISRPERKSFQETVEIKEVLQSKIHHVQYDPDIDVENYSGLIKGNFLARVNEKDIDKAILGRKWPVTLDPADATITLTKVVAGLVADGQSHVDYTATGTNMQVSSM